MTLFGCAAVRWLPFKSPCSNAIRVYSSRIRIPRRRRLYGSLARWTSVDGLPRACKFSVFFDQKNGHSSKSMNSFDTGPTCMRAVNRQPLFTARGTRRAFSFALHVSCSMSRVLCWTRIFERQPPRAEKPKNVIKRQKKEKFGNFISILGDLKWILYTLKHSRSLSTHPISFLEAS